MSESRRATVKGASRQRIATLRLTRCIQVHADTSWTVRRGSFSEWNGYILEMVTKDGVRGIGYIDALVEFSDGWDVHKAAVVTLAPVVLGRDPFEIEAILMDVDDRLEGHRFVKAAIDTALHEIVATTLGLPLFNLFGGAVRRQIDATQIIPIKSPADMAVVAAERVTNGFRFIKVKLAGDVVTDVERVRAVRERIGPTLSLSVDANQGYASAKEAIRALRRMERYDVAFAEQPIAYVNKRGLREIRRATDIKIEADEAAISLDDVYELVSMEAVDTLNLRVNELGGFRNTIAAMRLCEMAHVGYRFSAYGPQVTAAHVAHVAASARHLHAACDVAEYLQLRDDPFDGLTVNAGALQVPESPGAGVRYRPVASHEIELSA